MAAANDRVGARQPSPPASGGAPDPVSVDADWLAQALEARKLAFHLHRLHLQKDLSSVCDEAYGTRLTADVGKLMADYLAASEKLFDLAVALAHKSQSSSRVDNSNGEASPGGVSNERVKE